MVKIECMEWIYLSPHLDDVALSCGGLIWEQIRAGEAVSIWTICAGEPPPGPLSTFAESLHKRWKTGREAIEQRRNEDIAACSHLEATFRHFSIPDCIYRLAPESGEHLYTSEDSLFGEIDPREAILIRSLRAELASSLPFDVQVVCPISIGGHVDHRLTRAAASGLAQSLWYYADYPYVLDKQDLLSQLIEQGWKGVKNSISESGMKAWEKAVSEYRSQISTFWNSLADMRAALRVYKRQMGGVTLWQSPGETYPGHIESHPTTN